MARFRGLVCGSTSEVTRCGGKHTGLRTEANGERLGVNVVAYVNEQGEDVFSITVTDGTDLSFWKSYHLGHVIKGVFVAETGFARSIAALGPRVKLWRDDE